MQVLMIISMAVTAIATGVIAWYAWKSNELSSKIQSRDDEFRQQASDLYKAIAISNMVIVQGERYRGRPNDQAAEIKTRIKLFEEFYKGETPIFSERR